MSAVDRDRYRSAMHAVQSGVAIVMQHEEGETSAKHLRVGVNAAMVENSALALLLVEKGVITRDELDRALAEGAEGEQSRYTQRVRRLLGDDLVTLA